MKSLFESGAPERMLARIDSLTPQTQALWGKMSVGQMVVHCTMQYRIALGEMKAAYKKSPVGTFPLKHLFIYVLPTPKGVPTLAEMKDPVAGEWEKDRAELKAAMLRFVKSDPAVPLARHGAFGELTRAQWGRLGWSHLDHHLRQFNA